ncbi:hypothetical protein [Streptomyces sp. NPDC091212]|uniref:hypothetical protein n=1 Tax=Streptomyces sp. NPDC091212 TaxID=3155191 RepID=UPI00341C2283
MNDDTTFGVGDGPVADVSVSLHVGNISALEARRPTVILTSDPEDLELLCGRDIRVVKV